MEDAAGRPYVIMGFEEETVGSRAKDKERLTGM